MAESYMARSLRAAGKIPPLVEEAAVAGLKVADKGLDASIYVGRHGRRLGELSIDIIETVAKERPRRKDARLVQSQLRERIGKLVIIGPIEETDADGEEAAAAQIAATLQRHRVVQPGRILGIRTLRTTEDGFEPNSQPRGRRLARTAELLAAAAPPDTAFVLASPSNPAWISDKASKGAPETVYSTLAWYGDEFRSLIGGAIEAAGINTDRVKPLVSDAFIAYPEVSGYLRGLREADLRNGGVGVLSSVGSRPKDNWFRRLPLMPTPVDIATKSQPEEISGDFGIADAVKQERFTRRSGSSPAPDRQEKNLQTEPVEVS